PSPNASASAPAAGQWSLVSGNIAFATSGVTIVENQASYNYSFLMTFQLHAQIHQAQKPTTLSSSAYSNANSWNAQLGARNLTTVTFTGKNPATGLFNEFGVYQYTSISLASST